MQSKRAASILEQLMETIQRSEDNGFAFWFQTFSRFGHCWVKICCDWNPNSYKHEWLTKGITLVE